MVDQLNSFASEVTRVAREVGTEGKLGGQAEVKGVGGTWKDLTDNVNLHGRQPDRPGSQHRRGHDRGRQRRPVAEDHRRRQGRDPRAQEHDQHDGRSAQRRSRPRSRASRARSAPRASSAARRGEGRRRHVEGSDRQRQLDGVEPDGQVRNIAEVTTAVANGDLSQEDHRRREGRDSRAEEHDQHDGRSAQVVRRRR